MVLPVGGGGHRGRPSVTAGQCMCNDQGEMGCKETSWAKCLKGLKGERSMAQMTGGEAVVQALRRAGVEVVFGLPGVQIMGIYDAFYAQSDIRLMTVRHEQTTAYMADGYARVTGKPGVALVVPGPGVQNASAALGTAYAAS